MICAFIKPLPLSTFSLVLSTSSSSKMSDLVYVSLTQLLLRQLSPNTAPRPNRANDDISQGDLERSFLPFPAYTSSVSDNAKVSILVENLLRLFLRNCHYDRRQDLISAIENGILARENKIKGDKRRRDNGSRKKEGDSDKVWLTASAQRLRSLLALVD